MVNQQIDRLVSSSTLSFPAINASRSPLVMRLQPTLSSLETWGFGFSGLLLWLGPAPAMHAALGPQAIFVWVPGLIVGMLLNLQVKQLGSGWTEVVGGTPNYTTRLLERYPALAAYSAIGYFFGWAAVPLVNAIILSDLIKTNLASIGMSCPEVPLKIGFTLLAFVVAFSGTRALGILHLFFVVPALGLLIAFCLQGIGWLTFAGASPGFFPTDWHSFSFVEWAKWFFIIVYAVYACETASSFVADSRRPIATLRCLSVTTWLIPLIYLGGSWVLMRLSNNPTTINATTNATIADNAFLSLLSAATPFWGSIASLLVTFLIASSCLLSCATGFSNAPRVLYQLALDGYIAPVFAVVSRRGVLAPALVFTLLLSLTCIVWGDVSRVVMVTGTGYFCSIIATHLGLWLQRDSPTVKWAWGSLAFFAVECVVLVVGGLAWNWQDFVIGLLLPVAILGVDALIRQLPIPAFQPQWWSDLFELPARGRQRIQDQVKSQDFVAFQVGILLLLVCSTAIIVWLLAAKLGNAATPVSANLFVVLLLTIAFISIAVACWTSLPQVISIAKAREHAEHLFTSTLDALLVLDENRVILQANSAAGALFGVEESQLFEQPLKELLPELPDDPQEWLSRSEQILTRSGQELCIVEIAISKSSHQDFEEYVVILRNITQRKQTEKALRESEAQLRQQTQQLEQTLRHLQKTQAQLVQTEKMSTLGQLVAGVAHEINNPINFIHGNVIHASRYSHDLLELMQIYEDVYPDSVTAIREKADEIDLTFLKADLPKLLNSMEMGTERIREIVRSLQSFSRLDEAEVKLVDIHEGIDSTLMILQSRLKETSYRSAIRVVKEYADLPLVECYAGQLNQVFMNVLVNAIDALEEFNQSAPTRNEVREGIITIRTAILDAQRVTIQIADNGTGMTEEVQRRLLDPFFTTKPPGKGTGLGMAISYQIVTEKHGGLLQCMSTLGKGTIFAITIPLEQP